MKDQSIFYVVIISWLCIIIDRTIVMLVTLKDLRIDDDDNDDNSETFK